MKRKNNALLPSDSSPKPLALRVRVKRTTVESSFIDVELTKDFVNGDNCIDIGPVHDKAMELSSEAHVQWHFDYQETEIHAEQVDDDLNFD